MCYSLPAHALRVIADTESKQTAPELSPQGPRGNGPIVLHTVCGWDKMEWYYAAWLPWWYFWAWLSACCHWPRPQQMPHEIRGHCVLMCGVHVSVPTHISLASLAPCPKSRRAASLQTTHTHPRTASEHPHALNILYGVHTSGCAWRSQKPTVDYAYMHDLGDMNALWWGLSCTYWFLTAE